jgi:hypothetical protein
MVMICSGENRFLAMSTSLDPDAGHMSFLPYLIKANTAAINGGKDQANAVAGFRSWKEFLDVLWRHLYH